MRRRIAAAPVAALVALVVGALPMSAQVAGPGAPLRPTFGVFAGINFAHLSDADGLEARTALLAGAFGTFRLSPNFGLQPELVISQKGAKAESGDADGIGTIKMDYLEIPLLARIEFPNPGGGVRPFLLMGPSLAFQVGCKIAGESGGVSASVDCDSELLSEFLDFKSFDVGATVGGGLDFPVGARTLSLGVRYDHGLSSVVEESDSKNRAVSITVGIGF